MLFLHFTHQLYKRCLSTTCALLLLTEDCFRRPKLLKPMKAFLDNVTVTLYPNIEKFEDELVALLNEDRVNRDNTVADGSSVSISERRLMV